MKLDKHKLNCYFHSKKRAKERYGVEMSAERYGHFARLIREKKYMDSVMLSWTREKYLIYSDGKAYWVIFDKKLNRIVTFLPRK